MGYEQLHMKFDISDFALKHSFYLLIYLLSLSKVVPYQQGHILKTLLIKVKTLRDWGGVNPTRWIPKDESHKDESHKHESHKDESHKDVSHEDESHKDENNQDEKN